jgi:hypothetical protein
VRAERLALQSELLHAATGGELTVKEVFGAPPSGMFLVRANSMPEAVALARGCPHLKYGGSVSVYEVDTDHEDRVRGLTGPQSMGPRLSVLPFAAFIVQHP